MHELYRKKNRVKGVREREREFKVLPFSRKQQKLCTEKLEAEKKNRKGQVAERKLVARRLSYFCNMQSSTNLDRFIFVLRRSREGNLIKRLRLVGVG